MPSDTVACVLPVKLYSFMQPIAEEYVKKAAKPQKRKSTYSTLFQIHWQRVILDEAHIIRNHKTGISIGACKLKAGMINMSQGGGKVGICMVKIYL